MGTTPKYGFRYPDLSDGPNGPAQIQALAIDVETVIEDAIEPLAVNVANIAALPTSGAFPGQQVWVVDPGVSVVWDATANAWFGAPGSWTPTYSGISFTGGSLVARYSLIGKMVFGEIEATPNSVGDVTFSMPVTPKSSAVQRPIGKAHLVDTSASTRQVATVIAGASSTMVIRRTTDGAGTQAALSSTTPWTWATSAPFDQILIQFQYEAA